MFVVHLLATRADFPPSFAGVFWTGGSLNPARSFGPAVAIREFKTTQWIYWVGPLAGAIFAVLLYKLIKSLEYETANPDPEAGDLQMPAGPTAPPPPAAKVAPVNGTSGAVDVEKAA